jgi:hypothetical protein
MPGRLISAVRKAGCRDPLLLLDEVDKMGHDHRWGGWGLRRLFGGGGAQWGCHVVRQGMYVVQRGVQFEEANVYVGYPCIWLPGAGVQALCGKPKWCNTHGVC